MTLRPPIDPKTTRLNPTSKIKVPNSRLVGGGGWGLWQPLVVSGLLLAAARPLGKASEQT